MKTTDLISDFIKKTGQTLVGVAKICVYTRKQTIRKNVGAESVIIMGNGPSLSQTIDEFTDVLTSVPTFAVNFAANTEEFKILKPRYYLLADPHFFNSNGNDNVKKLIANLNNVDWRMTLFLPASAKKKGDMMSPNGHVDVKYFNSVGMEGFEWFKNLVYGKGWGMPRPRNVLIPSIMVSLYMGFKKIYIAGADHSWTRTISVNDNNEVVSIQPHFYKEDDKEMARIKTDYLKYPLHHILFSFYVAFKSYFDIQKYSKKRGVSIINVTPESFIDAFERGSLSELRNKI